MARHFLFGIAVCFCFAGACFAQDDAESGQTEPVANVDATHDQLRTLRDEVLKAIDDKNIDALLTHLDPEIVLTAQSGSELKTMQKHAGVREYFEGLLTGPDAGVKSLNLNVKIDELTILHGEDAGVAFGTSDDDYVLSDGSKFKLPTHWTATVVKDGESWKIASLHVSTNLFENPVMAATRQFAYLIGTAAGLIGLVLGLIVARMTAKKS